MLRLTIGRTELFDEKTNRFINVEGQTLMLEHSLISISKWESKWHKPFLDNKEKTIEEELDYIRCMCMCINNEPSKDTLMALTVSQRKEIAAYINDSMTATWFNEKNQKHAPYRKTVTSEVIYSWMVANQIPFCCEKWHLNRLLTLIRVCSIQGTAPQKMSRQNNIAERKMLNAARRSKYNTHG